MVVLDVPTAFQCRQPVVSQFADRIVTRHRGVGVLATAAWQLVRQWGSVMLLNAIGFLFFASGSLLLASGGCAIVLYSRAGGDVMWVFGLNGWQAVIAGLGCYVVASAFFALEGIRKRLVRIEAKLKSLTDPQQHTGISN